MKQVKVYLNHSHSCSYLPGKEARLAFVDPSLPMDARLYAELLAQGFRRSGRLVYRPACEKCIACVPVRVTVARFAPNRAQTRVWRRNADLTVTVFPAAYTAERHALYRRYLKVRHEHESSADSGPAEFMDFLAGGWSDTVFVEFRKDGRLVAVAVVDRLEQAWSSVYTFYDPQLPERSLGVLAVLWQIAEARKLGLEWIYLGYWVRDCRKMSYKSVYRPLQAFLGGEWREFEKGRNIEN